MKKELAALKGKAIVVDTRSNWIYLGTLEEVTAHCLILTEADAHDISDTDVSKEFYIFDSRTTGLKPNRNRVYVNLDHVTGFSELEDIKAF